ncbi:NAD(P)/FAD-dependent oxidoreductase [Beggiatoa leptomitoformis]|uniref:FAD-dependent oxidoreductase n=1 Tax=Beggiatoa leptomitoformis TaxID=288004 RepID=A0A2N9YCZ8_9GAMM|nr:FAD-binding oxidoreductase [Beggiatoa leptomitoformis]ALG69213.1 FAD-dependent oxidoreductase [Beggiatoa leptomitoformis]AUI68352.1 FAD-dependent oxidoreductase [Beggiatoa leptomitoformis]
MGKPEHISSYYVATANQSLNFSQLQDTLDCDVCIVGGGITGCSAALQLAERGYQVVLLEGTRVGWGASGRSGGQILQGFACGQGRLNQLVGAEAALTLWQMSLEAIELLKYNIKKYDIQCDFQQGLAEVAVKPRQYKELKAWAEEMQRHYNYHSMRFMEKEELCSILATKRYLGGVYDTNGGHLHPLNYTLGLAKAAQQAGVKIFEQSAVIRVTQGQQPVAVTAQGQVRCRHLILSGNAYLHQILPAIEAKVMPVSTYILATEPLGKTQATQLISNNMAVADVNFVLDYFRLSADWRLLFGGGVSYSTVDPIHLTQTMRRKMLRVFPQLQAIKPAFAWGGHVAITINRAPHFGRVGSNVYFAQGYSGHGLAMAGFAGKLMAEALAGTSERFDLFGEIPHHPFPGGRWLRMPLLVLGTTYYKLKDLF